MNSRLVIHATTVAACSLLSTGAVAQSESQSESRAESRAVAATHFEFGIRSEESDTSGSSSSGSISADLIGTLPLGRFFGASFGADYGRSRIRTRDLLEDESGSLPGSRPSCTFDNLHSSASLFFRQPRFGKVGITYGKGNLSADCGDASRFAISGTDDLDTDSYRADAEIYFGNFTFVAAHTKTTLEDGPELDTTMFGASWYPLDSLKVTVSGSDLYDEDTYGLAVEHQPEMLGDSFGVRLGITTTDAEPKTRTFELGLAYYFGRKVSLQVRDRQYR